MYDQLSLGDFSAIELALKDRVASLNEYQENCFQVSPSLQEKIEKKWSSYAERYGYDS